MHNDLVRAADADGVTTLILLDLSSAFDTVDHSIMLMVLQQRLGIDGQTLEWFRSYLADRLKAVVVNGSSSATSHVDCSVLQPAGLSSRSSHQLYTEYFIIDRHGGRHHLFAGHKQASLMPLSVVLTTYTWSPARLHFRSHPLHGAPPDACN